MLFYRRTVYCIVKKINLDKDKAEKAVKDDLFSREPVNYFVSYLVLVLVYIGCKNASFYRCHQKGIADRELWSSVVSYTLFIVLIFLGKYESKFHLKVFFIFMSSLFMDLLLAALVSHEFVSGSYVYSYVNLKIGMVLYAIFANSPLDEFLGYVEYNNDDDEDDVKRLERKKELDESHCLKQITHRRGLFVLFIGSRLIKQAYYSLDPMYRYHSKLFSTSAAEASITERFLPNKNSGA
jgi:hypothetical protein